MGVVVGLVVLGSIVVGGPGFAAEPVARITDIRRDRGDVLVKVRGESAWVRPTMTQLQEGDQIRALGDARVEIVFRGTSRPQIVAAANSPFTVAAPRAAASLDRRTALLASLTSFLVGTPEAPPSYRVVVRGECQGPEVVAPRSTRVLPGSLSIEWVRCGEGAHQVRLSGPGGVVWEEIDPAPVLRDVAPGGGLRPGARYRLEVRSEQGPSDATEFEVVTEAEAVAVRADLALLDQPGPEGFSPTTVALLRAGRLDQAGLHAEARRELLARLAIDPMQPALRFLLVHIDEIDGAPDPAGGSHGRGGAPSSR